MRIRLYLVFAMLLLISMLCGIQPGSPDSKLAGSNTEVYSYRYIVELYDLGDNLNLAKEILQFKARYPESMYLPYVRYIEANLALESFEPHKAQEIYASLLKENISQDILGELLLNYALSLAQTSDYAGALHLLQRVDSEIADPELNEMANLQRADIYFYTGQYYSAERAYQQALKAFPQRSEIALSLYSCYVKLGRETEALKMLSMQKPDSKEYSAYLQLWMSYLLNSERYSDFDKFVASSDLRHVENQRGIIELQIKRAIRKSDYVLAAILLDRIPDKTNQYLFYQALIELNRGNEAYADSLLKSLVSSPVPEISVPAYLERLKILYKYEPLAAIVQLNNYLKESRNEVMKAELYYTLGFFCFHKQDYLEAIKQLSMAKKYEAGRELGSRIDILTAEAWFAAGRNDLASDAFNRYLNLYQEGSARDRAWFYLGYINFVAKDYTRAKPSFMELIEKHPSSPYLNDGYYYLAEMDFYLANYNLALPNYLQLIGRDPENAPSRLRVAQIYYYLSDFDNTAKFLVDLQPGYEVCILKGNMLLAKKEYSSALDQFLLAESFAAERLRKAEAMSYRALCLYQMKRFKEASALYLQLSGEKESPDTYLFLSAKSAYAARDYHQALELYTNFLEQFPESNHFLAALGGIANAYYNMGNFEKAVTDWINLLSRFRNTADFSDSDLAVIKDALLGLELGMKRIDDIGMTSELIALPDTFSSQFIRFELNYIMVKLYADNQLWSDLIQAAEKVRDKFPTYLNEDIQMLMATGLIKLNRYAAADTLLEGIYGQTGSNEALLKWADLEMITNNYPSALQKLKLSFSRNPRSETWFKMLQCSAGIAYADFDEIWLQGDSYKAEYPQSFLLRLDQLLEASRYEETLQTAEYILNNSISTLDHATAFLVMGMVDYNQQLYLNAIATLKRVILLFPEYKEVRVKAIDYTIRSLLYSAAVTEAEMMLNQYLSELDPELVNELSGLIEEAK